jgi:hypothetical protein
MAIGQKTTSDDIAVENMLVPSHTHLPETFTNNSLLNQTQATETRNQPVQPTVASTEQNIAVANTCPGERDRTSWLPEEDSISNTVSAGQRAILSNIQNTGQLQQSVQKLTGKIISHRNDVPDVCAQATNSAEVQDISSISQNQPSLTLSMADQASLLFGVIQSSQNPGKNQVQNPTVLGNYYNVQNDSDHVQDDRNHVQSNRDHVPYDRNLVSNNSEHMPRDQDRGQSDINNITNDRNHVQTHTSGENFDLVTSTAHVNRSHNHVPSILGIPNHLQVNDMEGRSNFVSSLSESRSNITNSHVNIGIGHVVGSSTFAASINESRRNDISQKNSHVNSRNTPQQDHVVPSSNEASSVNNLTDSIGRRPFNLIDFISSNSSDRTCGILPTDVNSNQETTADILANKAAQDGQTALLENIMGFKETASESLTLPLTPKGSCGSGYGLGLDVDEFLNSEDGQRM